MRFVTSGNVALEYRLDGKCVETATPILLLNGLFGDMPFWDAFVEAFQARHLCIRMDHRGVGLSERWTGAYSYELYARDAIELLDLLHIEQVHVVGLCHGGMVGAVLARDVPQRLASLTLLGTRLLYNARSCLYDQQRLEVLRKDGVVAMSWMQTPHLFGENFLRENAPWLRAMAEKAPTRMSVEAAVPMVEALIDFALEPSVIQQMATPALFLVGEQDGYCPPWIVRSGAGLWPKAQMAVLPDCAHIVPREAADILHAQVRCFIESAEQGAHHA